LGIQIRTVLNMQQITILNIQLLKDFIANSLQVQSILTIEVSPSTNKIVRSTLYILNN